MKAVLLLTCAITAFVVAFVVRARSAGLADRLEILEAELSVLENKREHTVGRALPYSTDAREFSEAHGNLGKDSAMDALAARVATLQEFLREVEWRIARSHARLPDEEGFKRQLERAQAEIYRLREALDERRQALLDIGRALHQGIDEATILNKGSATLEADPQFRAAREAFRKALAEISDFQNRTLGLTAMDRSGRELMRDAESIAQMRQELLDEFKGAQVSLELARDIGKIRAANQPSAAERMAELKAHTLNARAIMSAMENQLAELEFAETVGPLRRNW